MIIDITGFGWSGSGAFIDLLREYDNVQFPNNDSEWECYILHWVDGVKDLEYKLMEKNCRVYDSDIAVKRFLKAAKRFSTQRGYEPFHGDFIKICRDYINSIEGKDFVIKTGSDRIYYNNTELVCFCWNKLVDLLLSNSVSRKILGYHLAELIKFDWIHTKKLLYHPGNFIEETHRFMEKFFSYLREDKEKIMVTNHLFSPDCPQLFFNLIGEDVKCIVVRRDPRDTFLLAKDLKKKGITAVPSDNIEDFIWFYKKTIQDTQICHPLVLNIQFEDLIYDYNSTVNQIEDFVGLQKHISPQKYFNPSISINNTQLFKRDSKFGKEINRIEKELSDSLYDFSKYDMKPDFKTEIF